MLGKPSDESASYKEHWKRLRQRFNKDGLSGFHDYEVVELLLTLAKEQGDCKPQAKEAIKRFGSVRGVLDASPKELETIRNIGPSSSFVIKFVRSVGEYYYGDRMREDVSPLGNSHAVVDYLKVAMGGLDRESFWVVYLNAQNRPTACESLFEGTLTSSAVYPREVFKKAIEHKAAAMIFAHNHPSGCIDPSEQDRQITRDLVLAASYMDVKVLDHIIVGKNEHFSFADHGLMQEYRRQATDFQESRRRLP